MMNMEFFINITYIDVHRWIDSLFVITIIFILISYIKYSSFLNLKIIFFHDFQDYQVLLLSSLSLLSSLLLASSLVVLSLSSSTSFQRVFNEFQRVFNEFLRVFNEFLRIFNEFQRVLNEFSTSFNEFSTSFNEFSTSFHQVFNEFSSVLLFKDLFSYIRIR